MSRRPYLEYSDNKEDFSEQDWGTSGSGIVYEAEKLIDQLHLSLGAIKAGNNSTKLKNKYAKQIYHNELLMEQHRCFLRQQQNSLEKEN